MICGEDALIRELYKTINIFNGNASVSNWLVWLTLIVIDDNTERYIAII